MTSQVTNWKGYLTVRLPEGWEGSEADGAITMCDENGAGALQASFIRTPTVVVLDDLDTLAHGFMTRLGLPSNTAKDIGSVGGTQAIYFAGDVGDEYWRVWHFGRSRRICCLTYNCSRADKGVEDAAVDEIVTHLELDF